VFELYPRLGELYARLGLAAKLGLGLAMAVLSTAIGFAIVIGLPADHFLPRDPGAKRRHPVLHWTLVVVKNAAGLAVVPLAVLTLIGPGPGVVFTLIALSLLDFPGKRALERKLLSRPGVTRFLNNLRARFGRAPLLFDHR
jgi:hypothetical protein